MVFWSIEGAQVIAFRSFSVVCRDRSVFSLVSFSFEVGMVVEICPVGSGVLPSGTITFPDGVVITAGGGAGVPVLFATVAGGVEVLLAAGTPADGFFATRLDF